MTVQSGDTIAAIATPSGQGGVGIIRISGPDASVIAKRMSKSPLTPRYAFYGLIHEPDGPTIDHGLTLYFPNPHSYTGEDVVEFQVHGGPAILDLLLSSVLTQEARLAEPGEFTQRAFLNNKIDLIQAEAIADLIEASSTQAAKLATESLSGQFSETLNAFCQQLHELRIFIEAALDFPDEDIDFIAESDVLQRLSKLKGQLQEIEQSTKVSVKLQEGLKVVLAGKPNAGKSSLLNLLSGEERAIVTHQAGTTRDVVREAINLDGLPIYLLDTAGIRTSDDLVEQIGISKAKEAADSAELVLVLIDANDYPEPTTLSGILGELGLTHLPQDKCLIIRNKVDLFDSTSKENPFLTGTEYISISCKTGEGKDALVKQIKAFAGISNDTEGRYLARRRHLDAIKSASSYVDTAHTALTELQAPDLAADDLRLAQASLEKITGKITADDVLGDIFSQFCIGK